MNDKGELSGSSWINISYEEMVHFHVVLLKISEDNRKLGGYPICFTEPSLVNLSRMIPASLGCFPSRSWQYFHWR